MRKRHALIDRPALSHAGPVSRNRFFVLPRLSSIRAPRPPATPLECHPCGRAATVADDRSRSGLAARAEAPVTTAADLARARQRSPTSMDAREISPRTATQGRENAMDAGSSALLERCARIGSSTWSDALDELGIDGVVRGLIQRSGRDRCAGFAVTIKQSTGRLGAYPRGDFGAGKIVEASGPGRVAMVDMGGAEVSTFGGLAALASSMRGATGIVIDGAARDIDEIRATGVWLASRFVTPTTGKARATGGSRSAGHDRWRYSSARGLGDWRRDRHRGRAEGGSRSRAWEGREVPGNGSSNGTVGNGRKIVRASRRRGRLYLIARRPRALWSTVRCKMPR